MAISEREANALIGVYTVLRKVVVVAGVVVLVAAVFAVVDGAFIAGQHHAPGAVAEKKTDNVPPEDKPQPKKSTAPVRHRRIVPPPEPVIEESEKAENDNDDDDAAPVAVAPISKPAPGPVAAPAPVVFVATVGEKHFRAHWKGRGGCDGDLFLTDRQLHFECPALPYRGLTFERDAVSAHDDGIRDIASRHKFHFRVTGLDKQGARILFNRWVRDGMAAELAAR